MLRFRTLPDALPRRLRLFGMTRACCPGGEQPLGLAAAWQRLEDFDGRCRRRKDVWASRLGRWQPPCSCREVQLGPLSAKELVPPRPRQRGQAEIRAPPPAGLLIDGEQRWVELVKRQEAIAFLFAERPNTTGGVVAAVEFPDASEVEHRALQGQHLRRIDVVVTDPCVKFRDVLACHVGHPAISPTCRDRRWLLCPSRWRGRGPRQRRLLSRRLTFRASGASVRPLSQEG